MKTNILIFLLVLVLQVNSQDSTQTLFKLSKVKSIGLYFASEFQMADLQQHARPFKGYSAMLQFNALSLGYSFFKSLENPNAPVYNTTFMPLQLRGGAFKCEYAIKPNSTWHINIPLLLGRSWAYSGYEVMPLAKNAMEPIDSMAQLPYYGQPYGYAKSRFAFIQPGIELEANLFKMIKAYVGAHYRFSVPMNAYREPWSSFAPLQVPPKLVSGLVLNVGIKVGFFNKSLKRK